MRNACFILLASFLPLTAHAQNLDQEDHQFFITLSGKHFNLPHTTKKAAGISARFAPFKNLSIEGSADMGTQAFSNFDLRFNLHFDVMYVFVGKGLLRLEQDYEDRLNFGLGARIPINDRIFVKGELDAGILTERFDGWFSIDGPSPTPSGAVAYTLGVEFALF